MREKPAKAFIIPLKWVFTYKFDADGFLEKFKARLCVRGDFQHKHGKRREIRATTPG